MASESESTTKVTVIGEALIDLIPGDTRLTFTAHPGGSPYNVAIGLARLGVDTSRMARLSDSGFGRILRSYAGDEGVDLSAAPLAVEPTTLAVVSFGSDAQASYEFYLEGTADWQWSEDEIRQLPAGTTILHFESIASWTPPGRDRIAEFVHRTHDQGDVLVSYDHNIRPSQQKDRADTRMAVEECVRLAHIAKAGIVTLSWVPDPS
jgi:fructokinase